MNLMNGLAMFKTSLNDFMELTKNLPKNISAYGEILNANKGMINTIAEKSNSAYISQALSREIQKHNESAETLKKVANQYRSAQVLIKKYPEVRDVFLKNEGEEGFSYDLLNLPVIISITTLTGSVISLSRDLFSKIKAQNELLSGLNDLNIKLDTQKLTDEQVKSALLELAKKGEKVSSLDIRIVVAVALSLFSGYWFFNKSSLGKDIRRSFTEIIGGRI